MYFAKKNEHTIPLFINAKILPLNVLYYKTVSELMHNVSTASICNLFTKTFCVHSHNTCSSTSENFYIKASRLEIQKMPFREWVLNYGMRHQALSLSLSKLKINY